METVEGWELKPMGEDVIMYTCQKCGLKVSFQGMPSKLKVSKHDPETCNQLTIQMVSNT